MREPSDIAAHDLECPQPSGESVAARDKSDRSKGSTPPSGERTRDVGQAGRAVTTAPQRGGSHQSTATTRSDDSIRVAALYVDPEGVYAGLPDVDVWDELRDARNYAGPWPVVAHPPCNKWSPLAYINQRRIPGYRLGDDGGCFETALITVEKFGGVLEHPAGSVAWRYFQLPRPIRGCWGSTVVLRDGIGQLENLGWVTEVSQSAYGHRARKRTWLYAVGCELPELDWSAPQTDAIVSGFLHRTGTDESRRVRPKEASATPPAFRDVLLDMARSAARERAVACRAIAFLRDESRPSSGSRTSKPPGETG